MENLERPFVRRYARDKINNIFTNGMASDAVPVTPDPVVRTCPSVCVPCRPEIEETLGAGIGPLEPRYAQAGFIGRNASAAGSVPMAV